MERIIVEDISITLIRKKIKNIHITVYPNKDVRVSAPLSMSLPRIVEFVAKKVDWIRKSRKKFAGMQYKKDVKLKYCVGERHLYLGQEYSLKVIEVDGISGLSFQAGRFVMMVKKRSTIKVRQKLFDDWYRQKLKELIPQYVAIYEKKMKVRVNEFGVKKMKTRWGTCNPVAQRIWINLELARKPIQCLEYIIVHEMVHLLEANHSKRFYALMDKFMPEWKDHKDVLNGR